MKTHSTPLIYAHRGGAALYPENTLFAFEQVIEMGVDFIDMDICMSRDNEIIVSHSPYLDPELTKDPYGNYLATEDALIKDLTVEELKRYNIGQVNPNSSRAKEHPKQQILKHATLPTLKEVVDLAKRVSHNSMRYQIEIKYDATRAHQFVSMKKLTTTLLHFLHQESITSLTEVQCFDWDVLIKLQMLDRTIKTAFLSPSYNYHFNLSLPQTIKNFGGTIWGPEYKSLSKESLEEAKKLGLKVVPWTVNDVVAMENLIQEGVDGIITDRPDLLRSTLERCGYI